MVGSNHSIVGPGVRHLLVGIVAVAIAIAGCSGTASPSPSTPSSTAASAAPSVASSAPSAACAIPPCDKPIVIGVSQALSGDKSDPGTAIEHGYQVWVKEINDAGGLLGRKVELKEHCGQPDRAARHRR